MLHPVAVSDQAAAYLYVCQTAYFACLMQMIHMGCFDTDGDGAVTDTELQAYIAALVPELPGLQGLDQSMAIDTYAQMAARKFLFFLGRNGK